jgi:uncharacterized protein YcbK (DUF882 family)
MNLSQHFTSQEFACKCGCGLSDVHPMLIDLLETIRDKAGEKPVTIVSGHRCEKHNKKVGGAPKSQHRLGKASDIQIKGMTPAQIYALADQLDKDGLAHVGGLGLYKTFVHIDIRGGRARWNG